MRKIEFDSRVEIAGADLTASEYKGILCSCDMVIAERMHVAIGALSSGIPTVPIGYSIKAEGIINQICNNSSIDASNYVLPIKQFLAIDYSLEFLDKAWENRDEFKQVLKSRLPAMIQLSKDNFDLLDEVISKL
jgi:colanic acid/amylovoran biosynthesis protein